MFVDAAQQQQTIRRIFRDHHITQIGVLSTHAAKTFGELRQWLDQDMQGNMAWMAREDTVRKRQDPTQIAPWAQTIITCTIPYTPPRIPDELLNDPSRGVIARYALFDDYHDVLKNVLEECANDLKKAFGDFEHRVYVDTGPILEREWANTAGLGFIGRNSNLIDWSLGSYLFLCEILVSVQLPEIVQRQIGSCGHCSSCKDSCPTGAIVSDRVVDARKCISYLTIEHKGSIPEQLRPLMKNRIYGCDICQEVCPWNRKPVAKEEWLRLLNLHEDRVAPPLASLLFFDPEAFKERFRDSPIVRAKREGFMRNVSVALGNWGSHDARLLLQDILAKDSSELVREHAQWGLKQC